METCLRLWLIELARQVPDSCQLEGFDISSDQLSASNLLPRNLSLHKNNCFDEVPPELVGKFDVVHVRALAVVVQKGDPNPLLRSLRRMLSAPSLFIETG